MLEAQQILKLGVRVRLMPGNNLMKISKTIKCVLFVVDVTHHRISHFPKLQGRHTVLLHEKMESATCLFQLFHSLERKKEEKSGHF